ncbi:fluoride efflux transporter CrcB [Phocaeicola oris]|uniref:fluoride efflux transporter CrcB n=1 Tax=Phocaeicola oris TaxID=2896850 RepID=UPI00234E3D66|nr:fluoride efflux transporter CrcB [Phocaeicola oris]MCE2615319.1 fluoride efflux transporter CrcB [Phocaeicola oris]
MTALFKSIIYVAFGGAMGSVGRFLMSKYIQIHTAGVFPWGTMVVNVMGCLLIGLLYGVFERTNVLSPDMRLLLTVGICGGFTTFSTFMNESLGLVHSGNIIYAALYMGGSVTFGFITVYLGSVMVKMI